MVANACSKFSRKYYRIRGHLPCNETIIEHTSYKKSPVIPMCPCRRSSTLLVDLMSTVVDLSSIPFR